MRRDRAGCRLKRPEATTSPHPAAVRTPIPSEEENPMIDLRIDGDVAHIVLDSPAKLNALDEAALAELDAAYAEAEASDARALVLRGEGRAFCAGRDISGVDPRDDDVIGYLGGLVSPLLKRMSAFPAPTFAA